MNTFFKGLAGCVAALVLVAILYVIYVVGLIAVTDHHNLQVLIGRAIQQEQAKK